ncbi:CDP-alcohol phosphatidyltransferase family protein [Mucilaginibacter calamicampi]|uniref:CDP-alcohol phosphatidyltransferase family protein n=1 Tax=Mucilaginibacter calamicampi TaxID=1302352 RepID=A0ABW2YY18_9SPHI
MKSIPYLLILFRLLLGPVMIWLAYSNGEALRFVLAVLILLGILSDIFDGIIARRLNVSTVKMRRIDSTTDLFFWLCVAWCAWLLNPQVILDNRYLIIIILIMEGLTYVLSFLKFKKENATHALISKFWAVTLFIAFISLIGFGYGGVPLLITFIVGVIAHIDVYLIILLLPKWMPDVPSCWHALQIRQGKEIKRNKLFNG